MPVARSSHPVSCVPNYERRNYCQVIRWVASWLFQNPIDSYEGQADGLDRRDGEASNFNGVGEERTQQGLLYK